MEYQRFHCGLFRGRAIWVRSLSLRRQGALAKGREIDEILETRDAWMCLVTACMDDSVKETVYRAESPGAAQKALLWSYFAPRTRGEQ